MNHNDKVVVITGAANGIGAQLTRKLAAEGAKLALADIDATNLNAIADELAAAGATGPSRPSLTSPTETPSRPSPPASTTRTTTWTTASPTPA
jgi:NADP-dependent 3-hydroxy acid dehydrogenase YdfG